MIRLMSCFRRRSDITPEQFRVFWNAPEFQGQIDKVVSLSKAVRYSRAATLIVSANLKVMEMRGTQEPFDGVLEYWWEDAAHLMELIEKPECQRLMDELRTYQSQFVDFGASSSFFTEA